MSQPDSEPLEQGRKGQQYQADQSVLGRQSEQHAAGHQQRERGSTTLSGILEHRNPPDVLCVMMPDPIDPDGWMAAGPSYRTEADDAPSIAQPDPRCHVVTRGRRPSSMPRMRRML